MFVKSFIQRVIQFFTKKRHFLEWESNFKKASLGDYQNHLEMIMDNVSDAIISFSVEGKILSLNKTAKEMLLINDRELPISHYVSSFDSQSQISNYLNNVKNKNFEDIIDVSFRSIAKRSDGTVFPVDVSLSHSNAEITTIITIIRDVSERDKIENEYKSEQAIKSDIIENTLNAIIVIDEDGIVEDFNKAACEIFGYEKAELMGQEMASFIVPPELRDHHRMGMKHFNNTGEGNILNKRIEVPAIRKNKEQFLIELTVLPIQTIGRKVFAASIQDITDRKRIEEEILESQQSAEKSNAFKSKFLASMSHEIRTPMNAILGLLGLLQETTLDTEQRHYVNTALESGQGLLSLINDILDFSKVEAGKLILEYHDFNVSQTLYGLTDLMQVRAQNKGITLASFIDTDISEYLLGDQGRIRQILLNLIGNAIKFTEKGCVVARMDLIKSHKDRYELCLSVEDTGIGINSSDQENLFDEFVQADAADNRRYGGTGLGLTISKKLVDLMGGRIEVDSEEGKGSRFSVYLTLDHSTREQNGSFPQRLKNINVAMLSAERLDTSTIKEQIESMGAVVSQVFDIEKDAQELQELSMDLMIFHQPECTQNIEAFLDKFRSNYPNTPCLLLLDKDSEKMTEHFKGIGFTHCISMGSRRDALADSIEASLGRIIKKEKSGQKSKNNYQVDGSIYFRVLLAEDSQANQLVAVNVLENAGYKVDAVANGIEAIKAVQSLPYDVILMDLQMPEMGGLEATENIRKLPSNMGSIPILAMTANVLGDVRRECKAVGMNGFIAKPINKDELFGALSELYERNKLSLVEKQQPQDDFSADAIDSAADSVADSIQKETDIEAQPDSKESSVMSETPAASEEPAIRESPAPETAIGKNYISEDVLSQLIEDTSLTAVTRMMAVFMGETNKRIDSMDEWIKSENWVELGKEAHSLRSSAASYGAIALSILAEQIEREVSTLNHDEMLAQSVNYSHLSELGCKSQEQLDLFLKEQNASS